MNRLMPVVVASVVAVGLGGCGLGSDDLASSRDDSALKALNDTDFRILADNRHQDRFNAALADVLLDYRDDRVSAERWAEESKPKLREMRSALADDRERLDLLSSGEMREFLLYGNDAAEELRSALSRLRSALERKDADAEEVALARLNDVMRTKGSELERRMRRLAESVRLSEDDMERVMQALDKRYGVDR